MGNRARQVPLSLFVSLSDHNFWQSSLRILLVPVSFINCILFTPLILSFIPATAQSCFDPLLFIFYPTPLPTDESGKILQTLDIEEVGSISPFPSFFFSHLSVSQYFLRFFARLFGIRKGEKLARFGDQGYAILCCALCRISQPGDTTVPTSE